MSNQQSLEDCLVARSKTALPARCIHTNVDVTDKDYRARELPYSPRWLVPALLIMSPILLYFCVSVFQGDRCKMRFGLSPAVRKQYAIRKLAAGSIVLAAFLLPIPLMVLMKESVLGMLLGLMSFFFCFYGGFALLHYWASPARVMRIDGERIWIRGCSPAFIESLKN